MPDTLSAADRALVTAHGISDESLRRQLGWLANPPAYATLLRPATVGDGITALGELNIADLALFYERQASELRVAKFVPASGAASRMFRLLAALVADDGGHAAGDAELEQVERIMASLEDFAFYDDLERVAKVAGQDLGKLRAEGRSAELAGLILGSGGLGYAGLPKALVPFHAYPDGARTAAEEHMVEAAAYARGLENIAQLHFTVSEQQRPLFEKLLERVVPDYEKRLGLRYEIELSGQDPSTDSIAVDEENLLFYDPASAPLFRPGGHGALLSNLQSMDADLVFIKNIDNCVPDRLKEDTYMWKRALAGLLLDLQDRVFNAMAALDDSELGCLDTATELAHDVFGLEVSGLPGDRKGRELALTALLDRPLRVCGMVRNVAAPGGGPFWCQQDGRESLQIVEISQVDPGSAEQQAILAASTHFNPVDIVVSTRRSDGSRFELADYVDEDSAFVVSRSEKGRRLRSVERPGLWNGSMAGWLTVFVEVPPQTFNPVKTLGDLLGPSHGAG